MGARDLYEDRGKESAQRQRKAAVGAMELAVPSCREVTCFLTFRRGRLVTPAVLGMMGVM